MMFPSQDGKTEVLNNFVGFIIDRDPGPALVIQPNVKPMAEAWSKDRLAPMIRDTPALKNRVADARSRDSGNTIGHKTFAGGHITIAGANSPAGLASRPIRYLLLDEIDRYPASAGTEGSPIKLAEKRTRRFWNRKILKVSSPTFKDVGIHAAYQVTDKAEWQLPCPDCGEYQFARLRHFRWPEGEPQKLVYVCEHCGTEHGQDKEHSIKACGKWVITDPGPNKPRGFWKNQLSSLFMTWQETIAEFLNSKGDTEEFQTFVNTALAEPWEVQGETVEYELLYRRREHYQADIPHDRVILTCGVDVQDDRFEYEVCAWGEGEESWSVEYGRLYGDLSNQVIWDTLARALRKQYKSPSGVLHDVRLCCIDSGGHFTDEVYQFSRKHGIRWAVPVKGSNTAGQPVADFPRHPNKNRVYLTMVGTDTAKEVIYQRYQVQEPGAGYCHWPIRDGYDEEYFRQATAEQRILEYRKGIPQYRWIPQKGRRNEALDCRVYAFVGIRILQQYAGVRLGDLSGKSSGTVSRIQSKPVTSGVFQRRGL